MLLYILIFSAAGFISWYVFVSIMAEMLDKQAHRKLFTGYDRFQRFIQPQKLLVIQLLSGALGLSIALFSLLFFGIVSPAMLGGVSAILTALGAFLPLFWFTWKTNRRQKQFEDKILYFTMTLVNSLKAGMALPQSLEAVTKRSSGPIQEEFQLLLQEYQLGMPLPDAFDRLAERCPCEDIRLLSTSIKLTLKAGGSLTEVLTELVNTIQERTEFQEKLKTMTAQGRFEAIMIALAPLVAFFILFLVDRELAMPMVTTEIGWYGIGTVVVLISIGFWVINKIVTIEV